MCPARICFHAPPSGELPRTSRQTTRDSFVFIHRATALLSGACPTQWGAGISRFARRDVGCFRGAGCLDRCYTKAKERGADPWQATREKPIPIRLRIIEDGPLKMHFWLEDPRQR